MPDTSRLDGLKVLAAREGLSAVAIMPGPNMRYLTGLEFHLSERPVLAVLPREGTPAMLVPSLEETKAAGAPGEWTIHTYGDVDDPGSVLAQMLDELKLEGAPLGVESRRIRHLELSLMAHASGGPSIQAADGVFASLRMRKDDHEIAAMRQAVEVAERAMSEVHKSIRPGVIEKELARLITVELLRAGSEPQLPFFPIVASGPNGANPHAFPTSRPIEAGDLLTLDWGATIEGYHSDITRTYAVGGTEPDLGLVQAYEVVQAANAAGREAARPGATGQDVDRAARAVVDDAGLGRYFVHRTGHGLGLEGHEEPDMNEGSLIPLEPGMTFTVEPGVYIPGLGGVRIEDDLVVTTDGAESLTQLPRDLVVLG